MKFDHGQLPRKEEGKITRQCSSEARAHNTSQRRPVSNVKGNFRGLSSRVLVLMCVVPGFRAIVIFVATMATWKRIVERSRKCHPNLREKDS